MNNGVLQFCHTSCTEYDAGPAVNYLTQVASWIKANPNDVVTLIITNGDRVPATTFAGPLTQSGLKDLAYIPPKVPMGVDDWPTLGSMISAGGLPRPITYIDYLDHADSSDVGTRVILFLDYLADQTAVPYLLDEFSQLWETPFSPTNAAFPCNVDRPPGLSNGDARGRMYMANHDLNVEIKLFSLDIIMPDIAALSTTNGQTGSSSLGQAAKNCAGDWGRPPNFLLVDYFEVGQVFAVANALNNV